MKTIKILAAFCLLGGCSTPYQEPNIFGKGVEAQQIDDRTVRVSAKGNGYTERSAIQEFVLLKSAETTLKSGFQYFVILGSQDNTSHSTAYIPGSATTSTYGSASGSIYGNSVSVDGTSTSYTTFTPAQAINIVKPGEDALIRMFTAQEASSQPNQRMINAQQVVKYLGAKHLPKQ